jgi:hypothetical protein
MIVVDARLIFEIQDPVGQNSAANYSNLSSNAVGLTQTLVRRLVRLGHEVYLKPWEPAA